ncbi:MAG: sugar phosphate isomerase/epimerase family protein [Ilumatobacteraceae bacterium]
MESLFLASATAPAASRADMVRNAAAAGFTGVGLRFDREPAAPGELAELSRVLGDTGLGVLDIEVIRIGNEAPGVTEQLFDAASALSARTMLTVSDLPDRAATIDRLGELADEAAARNLRISLEFMVFTAIRTLADAVSIVRELNHPAVGILPDALHMDRSRSAVADLAAARHLIAHAQLCDAPRVAPVGNEALLEEARFVRSMPGEGELDLAPFLRAIGSAPISVEVQSRALQSALDPAVVAQRAYDSARRVLATAGR